ncbi:MAG: PadR family transcriptional regulator [Propionibacteriaceae bacterium]
MSVKHSLLALLTEQSRHGYELKNEFEARTGGSWPLNIGQVYSTLDRAERDGLVTKFDPDQEGRVFYAITDAGRKEAQLWLSSAVEVTQPPRNELAIKVALAMSLVGVDLRQLLQSQRKETLHTLQLWTRAKRDANPEEIPWLLTIELMIFTAEAELRWLDYCESAAIRRSRSVAKPVPDKHPCDEKVRS